MLKTISCLAGLEGIEPPMSVLETPGIPLTYSPRLMNYINPDGLFPIAEADKNYFNLVVSL